MDVERDYPPLKNFKIRYTEPGDAEYMVRWFKEPDMLRWFPMTEPNDVEESATRWISFSKYKCSLTAFVDDKPAGIATLYLQPFRKMAHQSEFGIIVSQEFHGKGVGYHLMRNLMHLAKNYFRIELLHCAVYAENPAIAFYKRLGFREFGRQTHWAKDKGVYIGRVLLERFL